MRPAPASWRSANGQAALHRSGGHQPPSGARGAPARSGRASQGGDPMLFGRAQEENRRAARRRHRFRNRARHQRGLRGGRRDRAVAHHRRLSRSVAFVTPALARGATPDESWADAAAAADTVVVYMGKAEAARIRDALLARAFRRGVPPSSSRDASRGGGRGRRARIAGGARRARRRRPGPASHRRSLRPPAADHAATADEAMRHGAPEP